MCPSDASSFELDYRRYTSALAKAEVVSFHNQPGDLLRDLSGRLQFIIPFDFVNFALCDPPRGLMRMYVWEGGEWPEEPIEIAAKETAVGWAWQNQSVLNIDDLLREKRFEAGLQTLQHRKLHSYCVLPLTTPREKLGAIGFGSKRPRAFAQHDLHFLHRVAEMVALCLDKSLTEATLRLAPLASAQNPQNSSAMLWTENESLSFRDIELLRQVGAALIPRLERAEMELSGQTRDQGSGSTEWSRAIASLDRATEPKSPTARARLEGDNRPLSTFMADADSLSEWEELLTVYANASQVGVCIVDSGFRYRVINNLLAKMHGVSPQGHLGKTVREVLGDAGEQVEKYLTQVLSNGRAVMNREISIQPPYRTEPGHGLAHYIPIRGITGQIEHIGAVVIEITEKKKLEESFRGVSDNLRAEKGRAQVMTELGRLLASKLDVREVFPRLSVYLRRVFRQEYASISVRDEKSGELVRQALDFPLQKSPRPASEMGIPEDPAVKALSERAALIFDKEGLRSFRSNMTESLLTEGLRSLCCVPLIRPKNTLGVLVLGSTRANAFKTDDLTLLNQVASQLAIALENARTAREVERLKSRLAREEALLEGEAKAPLQFEGIIGESRTLQKVLEQVQIVADSDATVLLLGETGTGKGLIARALHHASKRKNNAFVTLNCAAIPTGLLESELFGHERGAFTGAVRQKIGRLELADKGTLFLDEIGEISSELQPKLLRVLQDHEFERLGGIRTITVDLRLVTATNRDLAKSVANNQFRNDLYYRLNVFPIHLPALRERREDIPHLVRHFVNKYAAKMNRKIESVSQETLDALMNWDWPGNVRELENCIERSVILTDGPALRVPLAELRAGSTEGGRSLEATERQHIIDVLRETGGMISGPNGAARRLGLKRTTLQSKMKKLNITSGDYSGSPD